MVELLVLKYPRIKLFINLEEGMANKNGSNKQSLIIYVFVSIVIMMMFWIGDDIIKVNTFDDKIDQGSIVINNVAIPIGTASVTSPAHTSILDIPSVNGEGLTDHPRAWNLDICTEIRLKEGATTLYAAAPKDVASLILIQMPIAGGKTIIVCGPVGAQTKIFLWTD